MLAVGGRDHRSRKHLFDALRPRRAAPASRAAYLRSIFATRAPQLFELFPDVHDVAGTVPEPPSPLLRQYTGTRLAIVNGVIKSAIVPVAGIGTRLLPATKSQPKEMLPVARKPIVQYVVEELVRNSIEQILFITGRNKSSIENHFDHDPELFRALTETNKQDLIQELGFEDLKANFFYTRQRLQRGLGDAILCGENFAGEQPFLVALGDSILGLHATSHGRHAHGRSVRGAARELRDRRGGSAARRDPPLRHRAAGKRRRTTPSAS